MDSDPNIIVDAHEDIAYNAVHFHRDFTRSAYLTRKIEAGSAAPPNRGRATLGLPNALLGRVGIVFGTLFVSPAWASSGYEPAYEPPAQAYKQALNQLDVYQPLAESDESGGRARLVTAPPHLPPVLAAWPAATHLPTHKQ